MSVTKTIFLRAAPTAQQQTSSDVLLRTARQWLVDQRQGGGGDSGWATRIEVLATTTADGVVGEKRAHDGSSSSSAGGAGARYIRCSRRHAEIDLTLLGPDPVATWRQCYAHCLALAAATTATSSSCPFVLLLLHSESIPPALGSIIHGFRTSAWHRPDRPMQFVFVGAFLPCAALQAGTERVDLFPAAAAAASSSDTQQPAAAAAMDPRLHPLFHLLRGANNIGSAVAESSYPFNDAREELYRAQMFCVGLPEIVDGLVAAEGAGVGAAVLASAQCRAEIGDWVARNRHVYHAEQIIHSFHRSRSGGGEQK